MFMQTGKGSVSGVERTGQALPPVIIWLIQFNQLGRLLPPILCAGFAKRFEKIEAAHDLGQPLHLALIERVDGLGG